MPARRRLTLGFLLLSLAGCSPQSIDRTPSVDEPGKPIDPDLAGGRGGSGGARDGGLDGLSPAAGGAGGESTGVGGSAGGGAGGEPEPAVGGAGGSNDPGGQGGDPGQGGAPAPADDGGAPAPDSAPISPLDATAVPDAAPPPPPIDAAAEGPPADAGGGDGQTIIAFLVGSALDPTAGDRRLAARMMDRGLAVRLVDHTRPADALLGSSLVVISASCASANIAGTFRSVARPVVALDAFLFDDMGMTGGEKAVDYDEDQGMTLDMVNANHELTAGLSGSFAVAGTVANMAWGRPSGGALRIASLTTSPAKIALFAYDRGTLMVGLAAPARRVGFFASDRLAETLTAEGLALFDAAITWALR